MKCYARWQNDDASGVFFRDQTILQFGSSWQLRANFILLNPGSALPINNSDQTEFLRGMYFPFFVEPEDGERYFEFSIDRLMLDIIKLFSANFSGGAIRLYNLFNLKNQLSDEAVRQIEANAAHAKMFSKSREIIFCNSPVIVASGGNAANNALLKKESIRLVGMTEPDNLFALSRVGPNNFSILRAKPNDEGFINSYHPSYTFKYGNTTSIGEIIT